MDFVLQDNGRYWPNDRQTRTYEPFKITVGKTEHPLEDIAVRTIKLMNSQKVRHCVHLYEI